MILVTPVTWDGESTRFHLPPVHGTIFRLSQAPITSAAEPTASA
jgi:hypothetical protein